ncbi:putative membrane protein [Paenibacillus tianmuensis]|uniref:Putative membrane protein n=1 Tax=Paenibacillus tianmuensis TaxID=624147 RepID=A0A1G4TDF3_9BACL|nr:PH domain-containing protein [Paenibacillus tianmuensis]SCW78619.1 putative membrane protein [Paenibacillus tianmuensis]
MKTSEGRLHPFAAVLVSLQIVKGLIVPLLVILLSKHSRSGSGSPLYFQVGWGLVALAGSIVWGFLSWRRFRYEVSDEQLKVTQGVFVQKKTFISLERIQSVDLMEGVLHRLFGLVRVEVQTAGGQKPEAVFPALAREDALRLRSMLEPGKAPQGQGQPGVLSLSAEREPPKLRLTYKLPAGSLFVAALTTGGFGVSVSLLAAAMSRLDELFPDAQVYRYLWNALDAAMIPVFALGILLVAWMISTIASVLKFANFTITRKENKLLLTRGLLERRQVTVPLRRIQAIRIVEEPLWQLFGFSALYAETAGYGAQKGENAHLFPLLRNREIGEFAKRMTPLFEVPASLKHHTLPRRALWCYALPAPLVLALAAVAAGLIAPWAYAGLLLCPLVMIWQGWRYRSAGWSREGRMLVLRFRRLAKTTAVIPLPRVQSVSVEIGPLQRKLGLSTLRIAVASGRRGAFFRLAGVPEQEARELVRWYMDRNKR